MTAHVFDLITWEAEPGRVLGSSQSGLHTKFQTSQGYIVRPCPEEKEGGGGKGGEDEEGDGDLGKSQPFLNYYKISKMPSKRLKHIIQDRNQEYNQARCLLQPARWAQS